MEFGLQGELQIPRKSFSRRLGKWLDWHNLQQMNLWLINFKNNKPKNPQDKEEQDKNDAEFAKLVVKSFDKELDN